jgi:hypothetical protein
MRRGLIAAALCAGLLGAYGLLWKFQSDQLAVGFSNWVAQQRALGWRVSHGAPTRGGSGIAAELAVPGVVLAAGAPGLPGAFSWSAAQVTLHVDFLHLGRLRIDIAGQQLVRVGAAPEIAVTANRLTATVPLDADAPRGGVVVEAERVRAEMPGGTATVGGFHLTADGRPVPRPDEPLLRFTLAATGIGLPPPPTGTWLFGPGIAAAGVDGTLTGPPPRASGLTALAEAWRDGGGTLDLRDIVLRWGKLDAGGDAIVGLDAELQPTGRATVHLADPGGTIGALTAANILPPAAALAVRLLAPAAGGGKLDLSLALRDRVLTLGPVRVAHLPELHWPDETGSVRLGP